MRKSLFGTIKDLYKNLELRNKKINFPSEYYLPTSNMKQNLQMHEMAVDKIIEKYQDVIPQVSLEETFDRQKTKAVRDEIAEFEKGIGKDMLEELRLAEYHFQARARNFSTYGVREAAQLEGRYGDLEQVGKFKRVLNSLERQGKLIQTDSLARWEISEALMRNITKGKIPYEDKSAAKDWSQTLELLESRLKERNIDLNKLGNDDLIMEEWSRIHEELEMLHERLGEEAQREENVRGLEARMQEIKAEQQELKIEQEEKTQVKSIPLDRGR